MLSRKSHRFFILNAMVMAVLAATTLSARANLIIDNPGGVAPSPPWGGGDTVTINNTNVTLNNTGSPTAVSILNTYLRGQNVSLSVVDEALWFSQALHLGWQTAGDTPHNSNVTLNVNNGGQVGAYTLHIGNTSGTFVGHVDVTVNLTNGSILLATGDTSIDGGDGAGGDGNTCTLNILSGSTFDSRGAGALVGNTYTLSRGVVNVDGENAAWLCRSGPLLIGNPIIGGVGEVNINNSGRLIDDGDQFHVFNGSLNITTGGTLVTQNTAGLGSFSYVAEPFGIAAVDGQGSSWTHNGVLTVSRGELTLSNGGMLTVSYIQDNENNLLHHEAHFYFNGGILKPTQNYIPELFAGRAPDDLILIDAGTRPALTLQLDGNDGVFTARVFTGNGGIAKTGTGNLILTSDQQYTGLTDVQGGTLRGEASFAGSFKISGGGTYIPGHYPYGGGTINIAGDYTQETGGILRMDIGSLATDTLAVGGTITLDGVLEIFIQGEPDAEYYVLFDNLGGSPVHGTFADIFINDIPLEITPIAGMGGGGSFEFFGSTYYFSYAGNAANGLPFGGNDLILTTLIPEPASLAILGLGAAAMLVRRRK